MHSHLQTGAHDARPAPLGLVQVRDSPGLIVMCRALAFVQRAHCRELRTQVLTRNEDREGRQVFLSRQSLALRWDTTPGRLATLAHRGSGPAYVKVGQRVLYPLAGVEAYEAANLVQPGRAA